MNKQEIKKIIPHREEMLLIDQAQIIDSNHSVGYYTVRGDEWFLKGHFPNNPVVPGVILCEIMAQSCCVLFSDKAKNCTPYFTGINKVKFKNKVFPKNKIRIECNLIKTRPPFYFAQGNGYVNDKLCVSGEFSFALIEDRS